MDTGTMTVAGNNWDIINDILDTQSMSARKYKERHVNNYFEGFEGYPAAMNDTNILNYTGRHNPNESNLFQVRDLAQTCGHKPVCVQMFGNKCKERKRMWFDCYQKWQAANLQQKTAGDAVASDEAAKAAEAAKLQGAPQTSGMGGAWIWAVIGLLVVVIILALVFARKKSQTR